MPIKNTFKAWLHINYSVSREVYSFYSNVIGNIVLFIPFSIIIIVLFKVRKPAYILLFSAGVSLLVELFQYVFRIGVADIDDIILNVFGALIGVVIFNIFKKTLRRLSQSHIYT